MRSRIRLVSVLLALLFSVFAAGPSLAENTENVKIMVLPFEVNADAKLDYLHSSLPKMLADRLSALGFAVVDQDVVFDLIKKKKVKFLDLGIAKSLGVAAGAHYVIYGSLNQVGDSISLDARLVDALSGKPTKPLYVEEKGRSSVLPAVEKLVSQVKTNVFASEIITDISVRGLKSLDKDVILMRLTVKKGDPFDPTALNSEIKRIFELGYFDDVRISVEDLAEGKRLIVDVVEKPRIQAIGVIGGGGIDEDDVIAVMNTKKGSVLNPKVLAEDLKKIRELYRKEGFYLANISYEIEGKNTGQARLNIVVEQAKKLYIDNIIIEGNEAFSDGDLEDQMALSERGIISWLTGSGVLHEELLDRDAAAIEDFYANHGYIDAQVAPPKVDYTEDGIDITFNITEGSRYRVGTVEFGGELLVPREQLIPMVDTCAMAEDGDYFNRKVLRLDSERLTNFYKDDGYAYADVDIKMDKSSDGNSVNITFVMTKNQKVYVRRVTIEGNTKTRDNVIRRELELNDGDLFSGSQLMLSNERLQRLDLFESADIEGVPTGDPNEIDLKVKVKEKSTGSLSGGVGYSSYSGAYIGVKLQERNLFGKGYIVNVAASFSQIDTQYQIGFTNPAFMDTRLSAGVDAYYTKQEFPDFKKNTIGGTVRFSYPLGTYSRVYWGYRLDQYEIYNVDEYAASEIADVKGTRWASVATASYLRDSTNRRLNPSKGSKNSLALEFGGGILQGNDDFIKTVADTSWYFEMPWLKEHILHLHGQAGAIFENTTGEEIPVFEMFFLGGMNSIRGYDNRKIGPRDPNTNEYIGGDREAFINVEYIFPIHQKVGIVGVLFFDAGDAWRAGRDDIDIKKSIGGGLRWFSPMGPLRLEYGYGMDEIYDQDGQHKIEFAIGQFF